MGHYSHCFHLFLILELMSKTCLSHTATSTKGFTFRQTASTILGEQPYRVASISWIDVTSDLKCARKIISSCALCRGFVYDSGTGQCSPLLGLDQGAGVASSSVPAGDLNLTTDVCPDGFQGLEYGDEGHMTCLLKITTPLSYEGATEECSRLGGFLASVKSTAKLDMIISYGQGESFWVGLDDKVKEGTYIWAEDGEELTTAQRNSLFPAGQPDNHMNSEDCVHLTGFRGDLNDNFCWAEFKALCETHQLKHRVKIYYSL